MGLAINGQHKDSCGDENVLNYVNINTLVVMLYYSFGRCYNWGKLGKRIGHLCIILTIACKSTIISKEKV